MEMQLGAQRKPRDPSEDKYMLVKTTPAPSVNMNMPISLLKYAPPILDQNAIGACSMFSVTECDFILRNFVREKANQPFDAQLAHAGFLYEQARRRRGVFPFDYGSVPSDGFDILLTDKPLLSRAPYVPRADFDYDDNLFINATPIDDIQSHRPFFVYEGNMPEQIVQCLTNGWPVEIAMNWHPLFFNPKDGALPEGLTFDPNYGGHSMTVRAWNPARQEFGVINHWTQFWNTIIISRGFDYRPGEVAIPISFFLGGNSPIWEGRAASPEPVLVNPDPQPQPEPQPTPNPIPDPGLIPKIEIVSYKPGNQKLFIYGQNLQKATLRVDDIARPVIVSGTTLLTVKRIILSPGKHIAIATSSVGSSVPFLFTSR